jgi:maleate cis-trans isomerase
MHHFGVLVPSTNTIVEMEYGQLLPSTLQVHVARIPAGAGDDTDADYQSHLLGSAKIKVVALAQTGVTLSADDL